jgi:uncharacterized protein YjbI with pentapeptide repeats
MWLIAIVIAVLTAGAVVVLWWSATAGLNGAELVTARLDALKIGLSIGVGSGGVVALYLAWRRQHSTEADLDNRERALVLQQEVATATMAHQARVARAAEHDAAERRLTELYLKAVEQLGSAQAAVRHGGLYALERVAQDNPSQRQTVVDVICAYLRNPFTPPAETSEPRPLGVRRPLLRSAAVRCRHTSFAGAGHGGEDRRQEREVRLTAQYILHSHLQLGDDPDRPPDAFWPDIALDLAGAVLIDFSLGNCHFRSARFDKAVFTRDVLFRGATVTGTASFGAATFTRSAFFDNVTFRDAWFGAATFTDTAHFDGATFTGPVSFAEASFIGDASFVGATRQGLAFDPAKGATRDAALLRPGGRPCE